MRYKKSDRIRLYEMMEKINKVKINEELTEKIKLLDFAIKTLISGGLKPEKNGMNSTILQSLDDGSFVVIDGTDRNNNEYLFRFKIDGEDDGDGVYSVTDVDLIEFNFSKPQSDFNVEYLDGGEELDNFNSEHGAELYDTLNEYIGDSITLEKSIDDKDVEDDTSNDIESDSGKDDLDEQIDRILLKESNNDDFLNTQDFERNKNDFDKEYGQIDNKNKNLTLKGKQKIWGTGDEGRGGLYAKDDKNNRYSDIFPDSRRTDFPGRKKNDDDIQNETVIPDENGEYLEGGLADGRTSSDFDSEQIAKGIRVEMEHTNDPKVALEIAMDHLQEIPDYYDRLDNMESDAETQNMPVNDISGDYLEVEDPDLCSQWDDELSQEDKMERDMLGFSPMTLNTVVNEEFKIFEDDDIEEGVGDTYLKNKYGIPGEFDDFNKNFDAKNIKSEKYPFEDGSFIVKNPTSLTGFDPDVRGIIVGNGDTYILTKSLDILHYSIIKFLQRRGVLSGRSRDYDTLLPSKVGYLSIQRAGDNNLFMVGEGGVCSTHTLHVFNKYDGAKRDLLQRNSLPVDTPKEVFFKKCKDDTNNFINKAKTTTPNLEFTIENILSYNGYNGVYNRFVNQGGGQKNYLNEKNK
jgi:hypothetical protein